MLLQHPAFNDIQQEVPEDKLDDWQAMGWVPARPAAPIPTENGEPDTIDGGNVGDDEAH